MFKKYFIPHKNNEHKPYFLRKRSVLAMLVFILLLESFFLAQIFFIFRYTNLLSSILPGVLIDLANADRQQNNLLSLKTNSLLAQAAQEKANDMAQKGYFAHTSPEGITPWFWLEKVGYSYQAAGENLAVNFTDSKDIDSAWMNSPSHRANILNNNFTEIGIATANGLYKGNETMFVVQFFGRPKAALAKAAAAETQETEPVSKSETEKKEETPVLNETPPSEMSVVKEVEEETTVSGAAVENPLPEEEEFVSQPSFFEKALVMPRTATNFIYFTIAAIILLAILLKVFVKVRIQYPKLIANGVLVLFVVISILYLNCLIAGQGGIF